MSYPEYREEVPKHLEVSPETLRPEEYKEEMPEKEIPEVLYTKDDVVPTEEVQRKEHHANRWLIIASGAALASDGYFNNVMTMTNTLFGKLLGKQVYTSHYSTQISNASIVGSIIGMIVIGVFCDRVGRRAGIVVTTTMLVLGAIFATAAYPVHGDPHKMFWWLTVTRGAIGVGVGGEYPASSTATSEAANEMFSARNRSSIFILVTNLLLALGGPFAIIVFLIVLSATTYDNTNSKHAQRDLWITWRVCFGFGVLLPLAIFGFRMRMINSKLFRENAMRRKVPYLLVFRKYWLRFIGTAGVWFLYDFVTFPNGLFSNTIISQIDPKMTLLRSGEWQLLLAFLGIPGCLVGAWLVRRIGGRNLLMVGFSGYIVIGLAVGCAFKELDTPHLVALLVVLYGLMMSMGNLGPGNACGLVASESYPTPLRGTMYGLSAAFGKAGAAVGTATFQRIQDNIGKKWTFIIAAIVGALGVLVAFFCVVDSTKVDLGAEDLRWIEYLKEKGWEGEMGDGSEGKKHINEAAGKDAIPVFDDEKPPNMEDTLPHIGGVTL